MIQQGKVRVNGVVVTELGAKADSSKDRIDVRGKRVVRQPREYILLNKPRQTVTTRKDPEGRKTVMDLVSGASAAVFPVGRLDFNTTGVLLLTNDGEFAQALSHPSSAVPRTYRVKVQGMVRQQVIERLDKGIVLDDGPARASDVRVISRTGKNSTLQLTLREGRNREVRRMMQAVGHRVMRLARVSFAGIDVDGLALGDWRPLNQRELFRLKRDYVTPYRRRKRSK